MGLPGGGTGKAQNSFVFTAASRGGGLSLELEGELLGPVDELRGQSLSEDSAIPLSVL